MSEFDEYIRQGEPGAKVKAQEESALLQFLKENPKATQEMIAKNINRSTRTVKTMTVRLTEKGLLVRKNGKRDGWWEVRSL